MTTTTAPNKIRIPALPQHAGYIVYDTDASVVIAVGATEEEAWAEAVAGTRIDRDDLTAESAPASAELLAYDDYQLVSWAVCSETGLACPEGETWDARVREWLDEHAPSWPSSDDRNDWLSDPHEHSVSAGTYRGVLEHLATIALASLAHGREHPRIALSVRTGAPRWTPAAWHTDHETHRPAWGAFALARELRENLGEHDPLAESLYRGTYGRRRQVIQRATSLTGEEPSTYPTGTDEDRAQAALRARVAEIDREIATLDRERRELVVGTD